MTMQYILADLLEPLQVELFEATPMGWVRRKPVQTYARQALTAAAAVAADQSLTRRGRDDRDHASGGGHPEQPEPEPAPEQAAQNNEDVRASTIADVIDAAENLVCSVWKQLRGRSQNAYFEAAMELWPEDAPTHERDAEVFGGSMTVIGEVVMRFCLHHKYPPYSLCTIQRKTKPDKEFQSFVNGNLCCTNHVKGMKRFVDTERAGSTALQRAHKVHEKFEQRCQAATVPEERGHGDFKSTNNLEAKVPSTFARAGCNVMKKDVIKLWDDAGGRSLDVAPPRLTRSFRIAFQDREKSERKGQLGDPFMSWKEQFLTPSDRRDHFAPSARACDGVGNALKLTIRQCIEVEVLRSVYLSANRGSCGSEQVYDSCS